MSAASTPLPRAAHEPSASETRALLWTWILSSVLLFGGATAWILVEHPENGRWIWLQMLGLASLPGKYVIFSGVASASPLGPWPLCVLAIATDLAVAATLAIGLGPLGRVPWVGPTLRKGHDSAEEVLAQYPRLRRMAFWGVVLFVYLPLPASGSIGGTFVGQLLGLRRGQGLWAVVLGGALVSVTFAALAAALGSQAEAMLKNPWVSVAAVLVFAVVVFLAYRATRDALRK
ncbi:MAG: small multi-drug export protein [Planctomycetota bacterium]|nr:small multi-drug export protein [Planctomycetota bacterium]